MMPTPTPHIKTRVQTEGFGTIDMLEAFVAAANKQTNAELPHHVWCNSPVPNGNGYGRCNCGVADILSCLAAYQSRADWRVE